MGSSLLAFRSILFPSLDDSLERNLNVLVGLLTPRLSSPGLTPPFSLLFQPLTKRLKPSVNYPFHLWEVSQDFDPTSVRPNVVNWVRYDGTELSLESREMAAFNAHLDQHFVNSALDGEVLAAANRLTFRDPKHFVVGGLHCHPQVWSQLLASVPTFPQAAEVLKWIHQKVDVFDFFVPFKGPYKGEQFNSVLPPPKIFVNHLSCKPFTGFISQTILDRLCSGAISLLGKVGEVDPPYLVMPLTVEPSKPRLCNDDRFLNLWMADRPFVLDTLLDLTRYVFPDSFQTICDD